MALALRLVAANLSRRFAAIAIVMALLSYVLPAASGRILAGSAVILALLNVVFACLLAEQALRAIRKGRP